MDVLVPVLSLVAGTALGLGSNIIVSFLKQRQTVLLRLLDQYLEVRKDVVETVSDLTHIPDKSDLTAEDRGNLRDRVAKLFYRHFDFLPAEVLDALLLLNVCLSDESGRLYKLENRAVLPLPNDEVPDFIRACSVYQNAELFAPIVLRSKNARARHNKAIQLHARHVLYTLNSFASLDAFMRLARRFPKAGQQINRQNRGRRLNRQADYAPSVPENYIIWRRITSALHRTPTALY